MQGVHRIFASVEPVRLRQLALAFQFFDRFVHIVLRQPHEAEQPVQAERRISAAPADLPILHRGALSQHGFRFVQVTARHVDHRHLKVREGEIGVERERVGRRA